jgi:hypothetical protein
MNNLIKILSYGKQRRVVWYIFNNLLLKRRKTSTRLHGVTDQKTVIFIVTTVGASVISASVEFLQNYLRTCIENKKPNVPNEMVTALNISVSSAVGIQFMHYTYVPGSS